MTAPPICPICGAPLKSTALRGNCPSCLLALAATPRPGGGENPVAAPAPTPRYFGDYELLREIARGGMGVVFAARQVSLNRPVALKMIAAGQFASARQVQRFRLEAEAAARLSHPNIVSIYEVGEHEGHYFYSMELLDGGTLAERIPTAEGRTPVDSPPGRRPAFDLRLSAIVILKVARAVHYAHQHGVLHRDLKPTNILLDARGEPHVADFGLAKLVASDDGITQSAATLGTPAYMAPEQAAGHARQVTTATDVYGLGAILYQLLTGQPPFRAETALETMRLAVERPPLLPRALNPRIDSALETICLKCLNKEPTARYRSAEALAEDLERWLGGQPVLARPTSGLEKVRLWCRRKPALAGLSFAVLLLLTALAVGSTIAAWRIATARSSEQRERNRAVQANRQLETANLQLRQSVTQLELRRAEALIDSGDAGLGLAHLAAILRRDPLNQIAAERVVSALLYRNFAVPVTPPMRHNGQVTMATFSPDGQRVLSASWDKTAQLWEAGTGRFAAPAMHHGDKVFSARFSPDGTRIVTASADRTARVWHTRTGIPITPPLRHDGVVFSAAFSPDGQRLVTASADQTARVWNATNGALLVELRGHSGPVLTASFSRDGDHIITASEDGSARLWDSVSGTQLTPSLQHQARVTAATFSPDGESALTASYDGSACLWDWHTGRLQGAPLRHGHWVLFAAFSPDNRQVVTCSQDYTAQLWDAPTGQQAGRPFQHGDGVTFAKFSSDGSRLVTASVDNTARVWDVRAGRQFCQPLRQFEQVVGADFSPDGHQLVTAAYDWTVQVWDITSRQARELTLPHHAHLTSVEFSADGRKMATASHDRTARVWDVQTGLPITPWLRHEQPVHSVTFTADGQRVLTTSADHTAQLWDAHTGQPLGPPLRHRAPVVAGRISPDGERIVTASIDGTARIWNASTAEPIGSPLQHEGAVVSVAFSPDGRFVATASRDSSGRVWDGATGQAVTPRLSHIDSLTQIVFSPDGGSVATASVDNTARIWNARTGEPLTPPMPHVRSVMAVAFDPAGRRLATASLDHTARLWDARTGQALTEPLKHDFPVYGVSFSPDGQRLATAGDGGLIRLWHALTGREISEPLTTTGFVATPRFSPDGTQLLTGSGNGLARLWDTPPAPVPVPEWIPDLAEIFAGCRLTRQRSVDLVPRDDYFRFAEKLKTTEASNHYGKLARWLFTEPAARSLSPFSSRNAADAASLRLVQLGIPTRAASAPPDLLDLSPYYNSSLAQGWQLLLDRGNDFAALPTGLVALAGVQFDVRGIVQLAGQCTRRHGFEFPDRIQGVGIGRACRRLHFLHSTVMGVPNGVKVGQFLVHRAGGVTDTVSIRYGFELRDSWSLSGGTRPATNAVVAWVGNNPVARARGFKLRLFRFTWENPSPTTPIETLDYASAMTESAPFLIAITAEEADRKNAE